MRLLMAKIGSLLLALALAGCTYLPLEGPTRLSIERSATDTLATNRRDVLEPYVLVDLTNDVLAEIPDIGPGSFFYSFGAISEPLTALELGAGDRILVTIFESSTGGLFAPGTGSLRPGNFVTLPEQTVSQGGVISVPYAGDVKVAGQTPQQAQKLIESRLSDRAIEPQVILTVGEQVASSVTLVGATSSKIPLRGNERILDVIARAESTNFPPHELFITLIRNGRAATVYFPSLVRNTTENILVAPGDILYVHREQQTFLAFGALGVGGQTEGVTGLFNFDVEKFTLNEAIAKAGGLVDSRSNAEIYIYRMELRDSLEHMGADIGRFKDREYIPTIYRLDYSDPSVFFIALNFKMRHKDVIYVANSASFEVEKVLNHTQFITSTVSGVASDVLTTRNSIRALGN